MRPPDYSNLTQHLRFTTAKGIINKWLYDMAYKKFDFDHGTQHFINLQHLEATHDDAVRELKALCTDGCKYSQAIGECQSKRDLCLSAYKDYATEAYMDLKGRWSGVRCDYLADIMIHTAYLFEFPLVWHLENVENWYKYEANATERKRPLKDYNDEFMTDFKNGYISRVYILRSVSTAFSQTGTLNGKPAFSEGLANSMLNLISEANCLGKKYRCPGNERAGLLHSLTDELNGKFAEYKRCVKPPPPSPPNPSCEVTTGTFASLCGGLLIAFSALSTGANDAMASDSPIELNFGASGLTSQQYMKVFDGRSEAVAETPTVKNNAAVFYFAQTAMMDSHADWASEALKLLEEEQQPKIRLVEDLEVLVIEPESSKSSDPSANVVLPEGVRSMPNTMIESLELGVASTGGDQMTTNAEIPEDNSMQGSNSDSSFTMGLNNILWGSTSDHVVYSNNGKALLAEQVIYTPRSR